MKQDEFIKEFNKYFEGSQLPESLLGSYTTEEIFNFFNHLLSKQPSGVSGYTLQNIEESIEFGLQYSFDQKRVLEYNKDKDAFIQSLSPQSDAVEKAEFEDLKQVGEIHKKILALIHSTNLSESLIEKMLYPIEKILTDNHVNLNEHDV